MQTLSQLISEASETPLTYHFGCQLQKCVQRLTKSQKPYHELELVDASGTGSLKVWNNHPQFHDASALKPGAFLSIEGTFTKNQYGLDAQDWKWAHLSEDAREEILLGDPELKAKQSEDWDTIEKLCSELSDPRLHSLCNTFIKEFGERFRRAAAARKNHHARRGGLTEHVAQMMRTAAAVCVAYPQLNKDLLITAVLFHDSGKLWENNYSAQDFHQSYNLHAEALGHISLGIELVNKLWGDIEKEHGADWKLIAPPSANVKIHLLHMIASHHGQLDYGSPVVPKTPEAFALHYIDNLDAKMEMCELAYAESNKLAPQISEKRFPLPGNLISPLKKYDKNNF